MKCTSCGQEFEGNFCPNCGKKAQETCSAQKPASKAAVALRIYRVPICIGAGLLALVLIAVIVICCVLGNIFRISKVARINVGDTPEQVLAVLGEPYGYDTRTQENSAFSAHTWKYYSANYQKLLDQTKKAASDRAGQKRQKRRSKITRCFPTSSYFPKTLRVMYYISRLWHKSSMPLHIPMEVITKRRWPRTMTKTPTGRRTRSLRFTGMIDIPTSTEHGYMLS